MSKLAKSVLPAGHTKNDFKCFGPVAERDGEFSGTMLCDMGCFKQGEVDSNKFYHAAVVQSTINGKWYAYFEYGRTGQTTNPQFQMVEATNKESAQAEYEKQLHSKNDKRGEWVDKGVLGKILQPKKNKDCYLVRPQTSRNVGLPDAKNISSQVVVTASNIGGTYDAESNKLINDLKVGSTDYARSSIVGESIPTKDAIDKCRLILDEATRLNNSRGSSLELEDLSGMIYSIIQKVKSRGASKESWILNPTNIQSWRDDLDVYENVVSGQTVSTVTTLPFDLKYIAKKDKIYSFLADFMTKATRNRHGYINKLKINHIWETGRDDHYKNFRSAQKKIIWNNGEKPLHQLAPKDRPDLKQDEISDFSNSGTWMLFHGSRSVNIGSILQTGLRLPKELSNVTINGAMYGGGIYCADDWKKSAGYCSIANSHWVRGSGAIPNRGAFMFICDMTLGNPHIASQSHPYREPPKGTHSIYAKSGPYVQNNEFIIFNKFQINLRYLVEFENV
jgi:hypothetical protein